MVYAIFAYALHVPLATQLYVHACLHNRAKRYFCFVFHSCHSHIPEQMHHESPSCSFCRAGHGTALYLLCFDGGVDRGDGDPSAICPGGAGAVLKQLRAGPRDRGARRTEQKPRVASRGFCFNCERPTNVSWK